MSKNFTAKTSQKWVLWSVIVAVIVAIGVVVMALMGVNNAPSTQSGKMLIVNVTMSSTQYEEEQANLQDICETAIADAGLDVKYSYTGEISLQSHELVYVFDTQTDLTAVKDALNANFSAAGNKYENNFINVTTLTNAVQENLPGGYVPFLVRNFLAGVVVAVLAGVYVALRHKLWNGIVTFLSAGATAAITVGLIVATRVVITTSVMYAVLFSMLVSVVFSALFAAKAQKAEKDGADLTDPEALSEAVPACDVLKISIIVAVAIAAMAIVGAILAPNFAWFALISAYGLVAALYSAFLLGPSLFLVIRKAFAKSAANKARYDYKK